MTKKYIGRGNYYLLIAPLSKGHHSYDKKAMKN